MRGTGEPGRLESDQTHNHFAWDGNRGADLRSRTCSVKLAGGLAGRGRHTAPRRSPRGLTFEPLEERQLLATTAISNLLNVPVQFNLLPNSHLIPDGREGHDKVGVVQGLYQGKGTTGTLVAYELVNNTLNEFVPKSPVGDRRQGRPVRADPERTICSSPRAVPWGGNRCVRAPSSPSWPNVQSLILPAHRPWSRSGHTWAGQPHGEPGRT